jgi:hypothetical protein
MRKEEEKEEEDVSLLATDPIHMSATTTWKSYRYRIKGNQTTKITVFLSSIT